MSLTFCYIFGFTYRFDGYVEPDDVHHDIPVLDRNWPGRSEALQLDIRLVVHGSVGRVSVLHGDRHLCAPCLHDRGNGKIRGFDIRNWTYDNSYVCRFVPGRFVLRIAIHLLASFSVICCLNQI